MTVCVQNDIIIDYSYLAPSNWILTNERTVRETEMPFGRKRINSQNYSIYEKKIMNPGEDLKDQTCIEGFS